MVGFPWLENVGAGFSQMVSVLGNKSVEVLPSTILGLPDGGFIFIFGQRRCSSLSARLVEG